MNQIEEHAPEQEAQVAEAQPAGPVISGFWRRLGAFFLDAVILGIVGFVIGGLLFDLFSRMGQWARIAGFVIAGSYFGILDSRIGKGQTIGKRLLGIGVVDRDGQTIGISRSLARYTVFALPYFCNGLSLPTQLSWSLVGYMVGFIVFGIGGMLLYLFIFNRRTRQSLHDLAARSFVVRMPFSEGIIVHHTWNVHYAVVGFWGLLLVAFISYSVAVSGHKDQPEAMTFYDVAMERVGAQQVTLSEGVFTLYTEAKTERATYILCKITMNESPSDPEEIANRVVSALLVMVPQSMEYDLIQAQVSCGFNMGIAEMHYSKMYSFPPEDWTERLYGSEDSAPQDEDMSPSTFDFSNHTGRVDGFEQERKKDE